MSRSYKKIPIHKEQNSKFCKSQANRRVRRTSDIAGGGSYRKVYDSWDICDWRCIESEEDFMRDFERDLHGYYRRKRILNRKQAHRRWLRLYRMK
ncbi:MAG: hypothetical protein ILP19_04805 [Oscillospiraceae bacterium]|nr:hypothetical protein [Oscillospiraceae bacterium]